MRAKSAVQSTARCICFDLLVCPCSLACQMSFVSAFHLCILRLPPHSDLSRVPIVISSYIFLLRILAVFIDVTLTHCTVCISMFPTKRQTVFPDYVRAIPKPHQSEKNYPANDVRSHLHAIP